MPTTWGKLVDNNLFANPQSLAAARQFGGDRNSGPATRCLWIRPKETIACEKASPAFRLGFKNFPMDQFGVCSPRLKALAKTPVLPGMEGKPAVAKPQRDPRKRFGSGLW